MIEPLRLATAPAAVRKTPCLAISLAAAVWLAGCFTIPVRVERADPREVHREITGNALTGGEPSDRSFQVLQRLGLRERFAVDPEGTLALLHSQLAPTGDQRRLSALAELSFYHADRSHDARYYLAAAAYAYALLFPEDGEETLDPSDPRVRMAFDIYNRGITEGMPRSRDDEILLAPGTFSLSFGGLELEAPEREFQWAAHSLHRFVAAADLSVEGLRNRYRRSGVGAPLSAELGPAEGLHPQERFLPDLRVPATAFVRFEDPRARLKDGHLRAVLEIYTPDESDTVAVDGRQVPVEFETSSSLAASLAQSPLWDFELRGFFSGGFRPIADAAQVAEAAVVGQQPVEKEDEDEGLLFLSPYRRGHIPVVLVHGTASSPARWANLVNELLNERAISRRYQIWLFLYNTGNPIGYSAGALRRTLERTVERFDPHGTDAALRSMVVIGHSQGGLLTKLTAVDSGSAFWDQIAKAPLDDLDLSDDVRATLRMSAFFTPEPFVKRVVFLCTPHHGSYLASLSFAGLISDLVAAPSNLTQVVTELVTRNRDRLILRTMARLPTSIDNMTPGNPFIKALAALPLAPGVHGHSIVAVDGDGPLEDASDGVVKYRSAHVDGVESELIVRSTHSAQDQPDVIEEIRRILLEHAAAFQTELAEDH